MAEIETDKATMGFETPEEGYLAKIMIPAGSKDVPIGKLVCIIVSDASEVAAFKDFVDTAGPAKPAAAPAPAAAAPPPPPPVAAVPPTPVAAPPAPAGGKGMTAVEQRGPRVYASPMAKKLAEAQQLRLEGLVLKIPLCVFNLVLLCTNYLYLCMQVVAVVFMVLLNPPILQAKLLRLQQPPLALLRVATLTSQSAMLEVLLLNVCWNPNSKYLITMLLWNAKWIRLVNINSYTNDIKVNPFTFVLPAHENAC